ncbi:hypothetical protein BABINDRAFT_167738 [Babjeviella inositovora NRRL Y-12698]|uniref:Uncharacterized protein n=1 Tax=Babjeviella inositovora NRRL Y-12698 TaxID=984486 RepID=A0A1E3QQ66_9ASCO|nr:uncharacterized protein BABINDRAFT_167738 [Babjeviella inositovora NRRL Y-12698]ODQ79212.1 hypothetical protein BABINDRAFT_167738 [Babjeviella inositovora NRRL Y-12698]
MSELKLTRVFSRTPSSWDPQDDLLLRHLKETQKLGWKEIAAHFSHRTPNACQFRWRRLRSGALKTLPAAPAPSGLARSAAQDTSTPRAAEAQQAQNLSQLPQFKSSTTSVTSRQSSEASERRMSASVPPERAPVLDSRSDPRPSLPWSGASITPLQAQADLEATALFYQQHAGRLYDEQSENTEPARPSHSHGVSSLGMLGSLEHSHLLSLKHILRRNSLANASLGSTLVMAPAIPWLKDEDELLLYRRKRELSFAELSILLPTRSEGDIWGRIDMLEGVSAAGVPAPIASYGQAPVLGERSSSIGEKSVAL